MKGCRSCLYWQGTGQQLERDDPALVGQKVGLGLCRRCAPQPGGASTDPNGTDSLWPKVASDDWCGEWQPSTV